MGKTTGIEWTDATWNPWYGCHKVSQGCKNCFMFREQKQYRRDPNIVQRSKTRFDDPLKWEKEMTATGAPPEGETRRIFTCSWSDWFIEEADPWRAEAWDIIRRTPHLTYQILTKRPENIPVGLPNDWGHGYPNVWIGVSEEDQPNANKRVSILVNVPAVIHFVSAEPLLGFTSYLPWLSKLDWIIVGGESGPNYRPMDLAWARSIRD